MQKFGATEDMYVVRVNNRRVVNYMMGQYLGLDPQQALLMVKLFDRKNKISPEAFRDQAAEIFGGDTAKVGLQKIAQLLAARSMADLPEEIRDSEAVKEVQQLLSHLERADIKNAAFDITLMRGLDYYTGTVFEFFDTHPENNRALFGGGRYDGLVGLFGAEPLTAVGMGLGFTTFQLFLEAHKLLPQVNTTTQVYVIAPDGTVIYTGAVDSKPTTDAGDIPAATNYLAAALTEALGGKPVTTPTTRPYGCSVKLAPATPRK